MRLSLGAGLATSASNSTPSEAARPQAVASTGSYPATDIPPQGAGRLLCAQSCNFGLPPLGTQQAPITPIGLSVSGAADIAGFVGGAMALANAGEQGNPEMKLLGGLIGLGSAVASGFVGGYESQQDALRYGDISIQSVGTVAAAGLAAIAPPAAAMVMLHAQVIWDLASGLGSLSSAP